MEIIIDWEKLENEEEFYNSFLSQVEAPEWHGHNLDALNDSVVTGQVNGIEPPYCIKNINSSASRKSIVEFQRKVFSIFTDAAIEPRGIEVIIK